jgi:hypothetical protein
MRRLSRDPKQSGAFDLFAALARSEGYALTDPDSRDRFIAAVTKALDEQRASPIRQHGRRVEAMFAYVAAALGRCTAVKQEDAGDLYAPDPQVRVPDYRLMLAEGEEILVEVKNCHQRRPTAPLRITAEYLDGLQRYAVLFRRPLYLAVYWSAWRLWTLLPCDDLAQRAGREAITLLYAFGANEMYRLGDCQLGTLPDLRLRLLADPAAPRSVDTAGRLDFTVGSVEMSCGGTPVPRGAESNLAITLMLYGSWPVAGPRLLGTRAHPTGVEFVAAPEEYDTAQRFAVVGSASTIVARQFDERTVRDGRVVRVSPAADPWELGTLLAADTQSETLPLWRLFVRPSRAPAVGDAEEA